MENGSATKEELLWIEKQQLVHDRESLQAANKRAVLDSLVDQQTRCDEIDSYGCDHCLRVDSKKDLQEWSSLTKEQQAFMTLQATANARLDCLHTASDIDKLEDQFGTLTHEVSLAATELVAKHKKLEEATADLELQTLPTGVNTDQASIHTVRSNWTWLSKQLKCADVHLQSASEYHQFFHEAQQYSNWMLSDLKKTSKLLQKPNVHPNSHAEIANQLLLEMKTAVTLFIQWSKRLDGLFERSKKIVPVHLRTKKLTHPVPAKALCTYKTKEITVAEGEEITVVDNSWNQQWEVRNLRAQSGTVPSTIVLIPGPDPAAVETALRLRLQFLALWTVEVKRIGKTIVWFLLQVIRDWTPEEEKMLRALCDPDKKDLRELLADIEKTFAIYWSHYPPYSTLHDRSVLLQKLLLESAPKSTKDQEVGRLLVIQTGIVIELLARYREFWQYWEVFKILTEVTRHPEFLLVVQNWKEYKFIETAEWLKKWQLEEADSDDEDEEEEIARKTVAQTESERLEEEKYLMERSMETSETSHFSTSELEEEQSFVITGVIDPRTDEEISFDDAITLGIINQREGRYVNIKTGDSMPIQMAMNAGQIKVELMTTKKSAERRKDLALVTIKTIKESRPYVVKAVVDAKTEKRLSVEEAVRAKIFDQKRGIYVNNITHEELTIADALDSGLLIVEFETDATNGNGEAEAVTKTYAIHAVIDVKKKARLTFREAIDARIFNPDDGSYYNTATQETIYVGDAIRKGLIKATVVHDIKTLDADSISAANRMTIADNAIEHFRKNIGSLGAVSALKAAAK